MADRSTYLANQDDQIAAQKRMEQQGTGIISAGLAVGAVAAFMIARNKVHFSRAFSSEVRASSRALGKNIGVEAYAYDRFLVTQAASSSDVPLVRFTKWVNNTVSAIRAEIPTGSEQVQVAIARMNQAGIPVSERSIPSDILARAMTWSPYQSLTRGAIGAVAPGAPLLTNGTRLSSGKHGSMIIAGDLLRFDRSGKVRSIVSGVDSGIAGTSGSRMEYARSFPVREYQNVRSFASNVLLPSRRDIRLEHTRARIEDVFAEHGVQYDRALRAKFSTKDIVQKLREHADVHASRTGDNTVSSIIRSGEFRASVRQSSKNALNTMIDAVVEKPATKNAYFLYKAQMKAGIGPAFAGFEEGDPQRFWRKLRSHLEMNTVDPVTKGQYQIRGPRYVPEEKSISGTWKNGSRGSYYLHQSGDSAKRAALSAFEGTFIRQLNQAFGVGVTSSPNKITDFISATVGATRGSYGEFAIRRYANTFGRLAIAGGSLYTSYKLINYIAHQTVGWGIDDASGKLYTTSREFQQRVLGAAGMVHAAKKAEDAFPGIIKSPAAMIARATAPYWMAKTGGKLFGKYGAQLGLALGIATALITWGDLTQSPEELHKIYTGEQDIPVRQGRWWMLGKTPFGGGKVMYYRPHWYPLMRSRYKYQGQLWNSESEEIANTGPLSPILSPLLTGKMWDPYRWEKEHYSDRPYPVTGELFEPTMPFAWLGNMTIGNIIKPQRVMHPDMWGASQSEGRTSKTTIHGAGSQLGIGSMDSDPMVPTINPDSPSWRIGEALYSQSEQMGIRGFFVNQIAEEMTGRPDFLPDGPVVQSATRATGYERSYWDMNIGDPGNVTEFFRRILPHRRRAIDEYNPIPNNMPDWMPGEDYYQNFKSGDPYSKVEMGEARLPGAGYESLHRLHSGIPHVYDAVDRFMILSDIAPYSKEYAHYATLANGMTRKDPFWAEEFKKHIEQRAKTQEEYEFLDLNPPSTVTGILRPLSSMYRKAASIVTGPLSITEPVISALTSMGVSGKLSPFFLAQFPISKYFPYKTATQTYKDYRLHGSEFTEWGNPVRDFILPYVNKAVDTAMSLTGQTYIPPGEEQRREYEEYFDKLQYVKYQKLAKVALDQDNSKLASRFNDMSKRTMTGIDPFMDEHRLVVALPKRERAFVGAFANAPAGDRAQIEQMMSSDMARIYRAQWSKREGNGRGRVASDADVADGAADYFQKHNLPDAKWIGWHPDVDLKDVQLKVTKNEGMNIHNFDLWESQERSMSRRPYVPSVDDIHAQADNSEDLRRLLHAQLDNGGYTNTRTFITRTPSARDSVNLRLKVTRDRSKQREKDMMVAMHG